jgi:raffinose synthase
MIRLENSVNIIKEKSKAGYFVRIVDKDNFYEKTLTIGSIDKMLSFNACYRFNACWMFPKIGTEVNEIPQETQFLMCYDGKNYELVFSLVDKYSRSSIFGEDNKIKILIETGDYNTQVEEAVCLYVIKGIDPYKLIKTATLEIRNRLKTFDLRVNKPVPKFVDMLGFCTYNAFYDNVTHDKIIAALEDFKKDSINIGYIITDAGWQNYDGNYTSGFEADHKKFPLGISETVKIAKQKYHIKEFLVWHTYNGFWCGLKKESFPDYEIGSESFYIPERLHELMKSIEESDNTATAGMNFYPTNIITHDTGFIKNDLFRFYFDFYSYLRQQGVDGTKLDAMSWIECFGQNKGGRVRMMQQLVSSLEASSYLNFNNEHINCSCCSNDFIYNTLKSNVTRSSTDYFPDIPQSHGNHVFTNAHTCYWMGEIILPDWDMFQSGNTAGEYHAMSKAISGGPVYFTDEIGMQKKEIINRLSTNDGRLGLCTRPALITIDSLFVDPAKEHKPVKIFNYNKYSYVIGAFNCTYEKEKKVKVQGRAGAGDIYNIKGDRFYAYSNNRGGLGVYNKNEYWDFTLSKFEGDIFTVAPVKNGYAVIGMTDKYNPSGFIRKISFKDNNLKIEMLEKGKLVVYMEKEPKAVSAEYVFENNLLTVKSPSNIINIEM